MAMNKNNPTLKDTFGTAYQNYRKGDLKPADILCNKILNFPPYDTPIWTTECRLNLFIYFAYRFTSVLSSVGYLKISSILLVLGIFAVITRKNAIAILMGIELILNSANINLIAFNRFTSTLEKLDGHVLAIFVTV